MMLFLAACGSTNTSPSSPAPTATPSISYRSAQGTIEPGEIILSDSAGAFVSAEFQLRYLSADYYDIKAADFTPQPSASDLAVGTSIAFVYQFPGIAFKGGTDYNVVQFTVNGQVYKTAKYPPPKSHNM